MALREEKGVRTFCLLFARLHQPSERTTSCVMEWRRWIGTLLHRKWQHRQSEKVRRTRNEDRKAKHSVRIENAAYALISHYTQTATQSVNRSTEEKPIREIPLSFFRSVPYALLLSDEIR